MIFSSIAADVFKAARPHDIVAQRHAHAGIDVNAAYSAAFGRFSERTDNHSLYMQTASWMMYQWEPEYLCSTNPFTMALPVGSCFC